MAAALSILWKLRSCAEGHGAYLCLLLLASAQLFAEGEKEPAATEHDCSAEVDSAPSAAPTCMVVIGSINIFNGNVFDLEDPAENKALFRLANRIHATTRPSVIRQQLLFETGEQVTIRELEESERILRGNRYIQEATIEPVPNEKGSVDVNVRTEDGWTLAPEISLSRSGGQNHSGIAIKEANLLGMGIKVEAAYRSDVDRDSKILMFVDDNLGSSWYRLSAVYADNSDGHTYQFGLGKPFYSLDATTAFGISFLDNDQIGSLYDRGQIMAQYENEASSFEVFKGWSSGLHGNWTKRYTAGLSIDKHRFSEFGQSTAPLSILPQDRLLAYPFVGLDIVQDRYEKTENHDQINRTEDRFLGARIGARLGYASTSYGSDRNAWILSATAQKGFGDSRTSSVVLAASVAGRIEGEGPRNVVARASARYHRRQSDSRLFYANLSATYGHNLDIDNQLLLGGDSGLRGYPLRYQTGDRNALLTLEQRYFTDWYPLRLFRVGGAIFFDAGRTWGRSPVSGGNNELLRDIGFGLRIGNTRSTEGRTTHINLAFPLDGDSSIKNVQFVVETRTGF